VELTTYV
jgi:hypothetical protein